MRGRTPIERRHPRIARGVEVHYGLPGERRHSGWSLDVSEGGLFVLAQRPVSPGVVLELCVELPHLESPVEMEGQVVWRTPGLRDARRAPGFAVQLFRPPVEWAQFCEACLAAASTTGSPGGGATRPGVTSVLPV